MHETGFEELEFTLGFCAICNREVLTYADADGDGEALVHRCVHCEQRVASRLRLSTGADLPDAGYGLLELQGCGSPTCGGGQCGRRPSES